MARIPMSVRRFAFGATRVPLLRSAALNFYWTAAQIIGSRLDACPGVLQTSLVRGMVRGPVPILSDIDFHLFHDEPSGHRHVNLMMRLRKLYQSLRHPFPMLGDIGLSSHSVWAQRRDKVSASLLDCNERLTYRKGMWQRETIPLPTEVSFMQRVSLFLKSYNFASRLLDSRCNKTSFEQARVARYLSKANAFALEDFSEDSDFASMFARSYINLHQLALHAVEERPLIEREMEVTVPPPPCEAYDAISSTFIDRFKAQYRLDCDIRPTQLPFHYILNAPMEEDFIRLFFNRHFELLAQNRSGLPPHGTVFLSPESARCFARCFATFILPGNWGWFASPEPVDLARETREHYASSLATLVRFQQPAIPGLFISQDIAFTRIHLHALVRASLALVGSEPGELNETRNLEFSILSETKNRVLAEKIDIICKELFYYFNNSVENVAQ